MSSISVSPSAARKPKICDCAYSLFLGQFSFKRFDTGLLYKDREGQTGYICPSHPPKTIHISGDPLKFEKNKY